jgi:putative transposase
MPDYRRCRVPAATYFFTINLPERRMDLLVRHIKALHKAMARTYLPLWCLTPFDAAQRR